jgi:hypothetical protein
MQQDLVSTLSSASAVVAHLKQTRDALTEDNKAKNEQIAGLIAQAQRMKAAESAAGGQCEASCESLFELVGREYAEEGE